MASSEPVEEPLPDAKGQAEDGEEEEEELEEGELKDDDDDDDDDNDDNCDDTNENELNKSQSQSGPDSQQAAAPNNHSQQQQHHYANRQQQYPRRQPSAPPPLHPQQHHDAQNFHYHGYPPNIVDGGVMRQMPPMPPMGPMPPYINQYPASSGPPAGPMYVRGGPPAAGPVQKLNVRCRFYSRKSNKCTWGDQCRFEHRDESSEREEAIDHRPMPGTEPAVPMRGQTGPVPPPMGPAERPFPPYTSRSQPYPIPQHGYGPYDPYGPPQSLSHHHSPPHSMPPHHHTPPHSMQSHHHSPPHSMPSHHYPLPNARGAFYRNQYHRDPHGRDHMGPLPYHGGGEGPPHYYMGGDGPPHPSYRMSGYRSSHRYMSPGQRGGPLPDRRSNKRGYDEGESSWSDSGSDDSILGQASSSRKKKSNKRMHPHDRNQQSYEAKDQQTSANTLANYKDSIDNSLNQGSGTPPGEPIVGGSKREELLNTLKNIEDLMVEKAREKEKGE